ncbi:MAG: ATP-binding cassette domain-containing protein [Verrucomicrobiota bacterium]
MSESDAPSTHILELRELTVERRGHGGERTIGVREVSFAVPQGSWFVIAGESGSGKSLLCEAILGTSFTKLRLIAGEIEFDGAPIGSLTRREKRQLRAGPIAAISREVREQINPSMIASNWIEEVVENLPKSSRPKARKDWGEILYQVGVIEPERVLPRRISDLSSLMIQRLMLMRALLVGARLLICDEPTAELDDIAEAQFIDLLTQVRASTGLSILSTSGSLRGVERFATDILMLYEGGVLELGPAEELVRNPRYQYTAEFIECSPRISQAPRALASITRAANREAADVIRRASSPLLGKEL